MFFSGLLSFLFTPFSGSSFEPIEPVAWHEASIFQVQTEPDPQVEYIIEQYLKGIAKQGYRTSEQGLWIQSEWAILANNRGKIPAPAASLTKVATTIASLQTWPLDHRFVTKFYSQGKIKDGVLHGDLVIENGGDPLFVWEEAIAVAHKLEQLAIKKVTGDLIVVGDWQMNYKKNALKSGQLFKQALNSEQWSATIEKQYQTIEPKIPRPELAIAGTIKTTKTKPDQTRLLLTHESLNLREILRLMNVYSNNFIAESLADKIGGGKRVAQISAQVAKVPTEEILLINGSGLGVNNLISPRAACAMFLALERLLKNTSINVGDLFPVAGVDQTGTFEERNIPIGIAGKTGTLAVVSALSGVIPTVEREKVYFAIINYGHGIETMRENQDILLNSLKQNWQFQSLTPTLSIETTYGDIRRNL